MNQGMRKRLIRAVSAARVRVLIAPPGQPRYFYAVNRKSPKKRLRSESMIEVFMLYEGRDILSLCNDIRSIVIDLDLNTIKKILSGEGTLLITMEQLTALSKLERLYGTLAVGRV
jgi:hypothetical protein